MGFYYFYVMIILITNTHKKIKEAHLMLTISNTLVTNYSYTPSWIKSERYLYCDNFARDLAESRHASFLVLIRKLLHR